MFVNLLRTGFVVPGEKLASQLEIIALLAGHATPKDWHGAAEPYVR